MGERGMHSRRATDLPEELYELPGQPPANLSFLLGQIVSRLDASDEKMDEFKTTALAVQDSQATIITAQAAILHTLEDHSKKLTRVDTAITIAGLTNAAGKTLPFLGIISAIITAVYWLRGHLNWGP